MIGTGEVSTPAPLTVMTRDDPQLRMTLRKMVNCVNNYPHTTRDPTFAREQFNNHARLPYIRTSNTRAAPAAKRLLKSAGRILAGTSRPTESISNKQPHDEPSPRVEELNRGYILGYDYGYDWYNQTMGKQKGCLTRFKVTAPSGTNRMTSSDRGSNREIDPLAEGFEPRPHAIDEVDGPDKQADSRDRPNTNERPERPETRPPKSPARHRTTTRQRATARQQVAVEAIVLQANALPIR